MVGLRHSTTQQAGMQRTGNQVENGNCPGHWPGRVPVHTLPTMRHLLILVAMASVSGRAVAVDGFAPLAVGNTWIYKGDERCWGLWWNPTEGHKLVRSMTVDSMRRDGGSVDWFLSFRDSLNGRFRSGYFVEPVPADTVVTGRFRVRETEGERLLRILPDGRENAPHGMEVFFKTRQRRAEDVKVMPNTTPESLQVASVAVEQGHIAKDEGLYGASGWCEGPAIPGR